MQAWQIFRAETQNVWAKNKVAWIRNALITGLLFAIYALQIPVEFRANIVIYPEDQNNSSGSINSLLGSLPIESKGSGTIRAILSSHTLRNAVIRDTLRYQGKVLPVAEWLRKDHLKRSFILGSLFPPPESGEGLHSFANRYLSRTMLIFTDDDGFISLRLTTADDSLTLLLGETIIQHAQNYHNIRKELKNSNRVRYLNFRTDSISRELELVQRNIARFGDRKRYTAKYTEEVELQALYQKQSILQQLLVSVTMLKEEVISRYQQDSPLFQVLDPPQKPLDIIRAIPWLYGISTCLLVFVLQFIRGVRREIWKVFYTAW